MLNYAQMKNVQTVTWLQKKYKGYFLELSQLSSISSRPDIQAQLRKHKSRCTHTGYNDGNLYNELSKDDGPLSATYPYNMSFTLQMVLMC